MNELEKRIAALEAILGRGNFPTAAVHQKDNIFNGRVRLKHRTANPAIAAVGEISMANNHLYVAKTANTWTLIT